MCGSCFVHHPAPLVRIDHRLALFLGGMDTEDNVWALCIQCHDAKTRREKAATRLTP